MDESADREDFSEEVNTALGGFDRAMGLHFLRANVEEVLAELVIKEQHLQPYGLVHGGVYSSMIETLCSIGASLRARQDGCAAVGLENSTSFLRGAREGTLRGTAVALSTGRRTQMWRAEIRQGRDNKLLATGNVRLLNLEDGSSVAGGAMNPSTPR
ncbi:MAG: PaaI family thioesterase [Myxococcota bacterium]